MLKLENLSKYYNTNNIISIGLKNINLTFEKNEIVGIVGESGSGKSTLLNVIGGMDSYEEGEMYFNGEETSGFTEVEYMEYRRNNVAFIFQNYNLIDSYTVLQNIMITLELRGETNCKNHALEIIDKVGLLKRAHHKATKLSGGEKQRLSIARALAQDAPILLCDEPTGNLDSATGSEIIKLIKEVSLDRLVIIVTHNYDEIKDIVTRKIRLFDGEVAEDNKINNDAETKIVKNQAYILKRRDILKITIRNIFCMPRKNILSFLVFLVLSFIIYFSFIFIKFNEIDYYYDNFFESYAVNVYFDEPVNANDLSKYGGTYLPNSMNNFFMVELVDNEYFTSIYLDLSGSTDYILEDGRYPLDNEIATNRYESKIGDKIKILDKEYTVSGHLLYTQCSILSPNDSKELIKNPKFYQLIHSYNLLQLNISEDFIDRVDFVEGEDIFNIYTPKEIEKEKIKVLINKNEIEYNHFSVIYGSDFKIEMSNDVFYDILNNNIYFAHFCFNDRKEMQNAMKKMKVDGLIYNHTAQQYNDFTYFFDLGTYILSVVIFIIVIIIGFYLTYVILYFIEKSKIKDFTILRILGIGKKDMHREIRYEMLVFSATSFILVTIIINIIRVFSSNPTLSVLINYPINFYIIAFLIHIVFPLLLASRFNNRLFDKTINKTLKAGE